MDAEDGVEAGVGGHHHLVAAAGGLEEGVVALGTVGLADPSAEAEHVLRVVQRLVGVVDDLHGRGTPRRSPVLRMPSQV